VPTRLSAQGALTRSGGAFPSPFCLGGVKGHKERADLQKVMFRSGFLRLGPSFGASDSNVLPSPHHQQRQEAGTLQTLRAFRGRSSPAQPSSAVGCRQAGQRSPKPGRCLRVQIIALRPSQAVPAKTAPCGHSRLLSLLSVTRSSSPSRHSRHPLGQPQPRVG